MEELPFFAVSPSGVLALSDVSADRHSSRCWSQITFNSDVEHPEAHRNNDPTPVKVPSLNLRRAMVSV